LLVDFAPDANNARLPRIADVSLHRSTQPYHPAHPSAIGTCYGHSIPDRPKCSYASVDRVASRTATSSLDGMVAGMRAATTRTTARTYDGDTDGDMRDNKDGCDGDR
jgi:hypothetical protein